MTVKEGNCNEKGMSMKVTIGKIKDEVIKRLPCVLAYAAVVSPVVIRFIRHETYFGFEKNIFWCAIPLLFLREKIVMRHPRAYFWLSWFYFHIVLGL